MAVNTQFSIAVHIMAVLGCHGDKPVTSGQLAKSVNTSASFVRRVLAKLSKAELVSTATGKNGSCWLSRHAANITLLEIYRSVGAPKAFAIHKYAPLEPCKVSCNIKSSLDRVLSLTQKSLETALGKTSLAEVISDVQKP